MRTSVSEELQKGTGTGTFSQEIIFLHSINEQRKCGYTLSVIIVLKENINKVNTWGKS
jgi:hypothetical protein